MDFHVILYLALYFQCKPLWSTLFFFLNSYIKIKIDLESSSLLWADTTSFYLPHSLFLISSVTVEGIKMEQSVKATYF